MFSIPFSKATSAGSIRQVAILGLLRKYAVFLFPACVLLLGVTLLATYLESSLTSVVVGYAAIASTLIKQKTAKPFRYAVAAAILLFLTWLVPVNTLLYLALACGLLFWIELNAGSVHLLGAAALLIASPAFQYAANVFSFPIRLQLAKLTGSVFSLFATGTELKGNVIFYKGHEFSVDPACMGLHMLSLSLLLGILLAGLLQRKSGRVLSLKMSLFYLACLFGLNLAANVLRIVLLVQFAIPAKAIMHDIIGLLCLLLYVGLPACYVAKLLIQCSPVVERTSELKEPKNALLIQWLLFGAMLVIGVRVMNTDTYAAFDKAYHQPIPGYATSMYAPGIVKLESKESLVYVKAIRGFYDTEHNPMFCWKGSGYELQNVQARTLAGVNVYTATLHREKEQLYTAWWYGNGRHHTTSQWDWRWRMLKGETGYAVQNVTAADEKTLKEEVYQLISKGVLLPLLGQ